MSRTDRSGSGIDEINEDRTRPREPGTAFFEKTMRHWSQHLTCHGLRIEKITTRNSAYKLLLAIRAEAYGRDQLGVPCPVDQHSALWLLWLNETPIGTIRGTRALDGEMDCEQHFPPRIRTDFTALIASASRFCLRRGIPANMYAARILTEFAWADSLDHGIRCDIIDVNDRAISYYERLGYFLLKESSFIHPLLETPSKIMATVARRGFTGKLRQLLSIPEECPQTQALLEYLNQWT